MQHPKIFTALAVSIVGMVTAYAAPVFATPSPWILADHHVVAIAPYVVEHFRGPREIHEHRAATRELRGAAAFVQAEPELTAEWLQLTLSRRIADIHRRASLAGSAANENDIQVRVTSVGTAFCVYLIAQDPAEAADVLRRARSFSIR